MIQAVHPKMESQRMSGFQEAYSFAIIQAAWCCSDSASQIGAALKSHRLLSDNIDRSLTMKTFFKVLPLIIKDTLLNFAPKFAVVLATLVVVTEVYKPQLLSAALTIINFLKVV